MEEQVELARQISHSLSSDTNSTSKGQSMYVKRRNRSSKWIHEGIQEFSPFYLSFFKNPHVRNYSTTIRLSTPPPWTDEKNSGG